MSHHDETLGAGAAGFGFKTWPAPKDGGAFANAKKDVKINAHEFG